MTTPNAVQTARAAYRPASPRDAADLLDLQRTFYAEEAYPFDAAAMRTAWSGLMTNPMFGHVWIAHQADEAVADVVVTLGYSLEHLGRDAFIDELYVAPSHRGLGFGRAGLEVAEAWCRQHDVRVLLLEVEHDNDPASALYQRVGFRGDRRRLLKRRLS